MIILRKDKNIVINVYINSTENYKTFIHYILIFKKNKSNLFQEFYNN